jgi:hypothetical protein
MAGISNQLMALLSSSMGGSHSALKYQGSRDYEAWPVITQVCGKTDPAIAGPTGDLIQAI